MTWRRGARSALPASSPPCFTDSCAVPLGGGGPCGAGGRQRDAPCVDALARGPPPNLPLALLALLAPLSLPVHRLHGVASQPVDDARTEGRFTRAPAKERQDPPHPRCLPSSDGLDESWPGTPQPVPSLWITWDRGLSIRRPSEALTCPDGPRFGPPRRLLRRAARWAGAAPPPTSASGTIRSPMCRRASADVSPSLHRSLQRNSRPFSSTEFSTGSPPEWRVASPDGPNAEGCRGSGRRPWYRPRWPGLRGGPRRYGRGVASRRASTDAARATTRA